MSLANRINYFYLTFLKFLTSLFQSRTHVMGLHESAIDKNSFIPNFSIISRLHSSTKTNNRSQ